jgi:hypothetical protein
MTTVQKWRVGDVRVDGTVVTQAEYDYDVALDEIGAIVEATEGGRALMMRFDQASADRSLELQDAAVREHCAKIRALLEPVMPFYLI